jgi:DNA-nicking Smr family endonuclease
MSEGRKGRQLGRQLGRRLSDDEKKLWRDITDKIAPLRKHVRRTGLKPEAEPKAAKPAARKVAHPALAHAPAPKPPVAPRPPKAPALAPLDRKTKGRIARGTHAIDARIDLHGHTQAEAHDALLRFLQRARNKGASIVLVITGKGTRGDGVLKRQVPMWLSLPEFREFVIGFDDAHVGHGGEGALYVRVRKRREIRE